MFIDPQTYTLITWEAFKSPYFQAAPLTIKSESQYEIQTETFFKPVKFSSSGVVYATLVTLMLISSGKPLPSDQPGTVF